MPNSRLHERIMAGLYDDPPANATRPQERDLEGRSNNLDGYGSIRGGTAYAYGPVGNDNTYAYGPLGSNIFPEVVPTGSPSMPGSLRRRRSSSSYDEYEPRNTRDVSQGVDDENGGRRSGRYKRRRIDNSSSHRPARPIWHATKYGHYGQVEPGKLQFKLLSCDGGEYRDSHRQSDPFAAENILTNDPSIFCTSSPACNIILKHKDGTAFCLEKLHIVCPERRVVSAVRTGFVVMSMTLKDLFKYLRPSSQALLSVRQPPPHARRGHVPVQLFLSRRPRAAERGSPEMLTLRDALSDPEISAAFDSPPRQDDVHEQDDDIFRDLEFGHGEEGDLYAAAHVGGGRRAPDPEARYEVVDDQELGSFAVNENRIKTSRVTYLSNDFPNPEVRLPEDEPRAQRLRHIRRGRGNEDPERGADANSFHSRDSERGPETNARRNRAAILDHEYVTIPDTPSLSDEVYQPNYQSLDHKATPPPPGSDVTITQFCIKRDHQGVSLKFSPPVSGKFILLKLWAGTGSETERTNVDLKSVIGIGYGGPRYFPATEMR